VLNESLYILYVFKGFVRLMII